MSRWPAGLPAWDLGFAHYSSHGSERDIEHPGSTHNDAQVELLKAAAPQGHAHYSN
jgi:hypothetical protein